MENNQQLTSSEDLDVAFTTWVDNFFEKKTDPELKVPAELQALSAIETTLDTPDEVQGNFLFKVARGRADFIKLDITDMAITALLYHCASPGEIIMYLYSIRHWQAASVAGVADGKILQQKITCSVLTDLFPNGFLTKESLSQAWDEQKTDTGNLLDQVNPSTCFGAELTN